MSSNTDQRNKLLFILLEASAGNFRQYQITFWAQLVLGLVYSLGYFDTAAAGLILGFLMPVLWIILTYRYVYIKARENIRLPFPAWMQKDPGNLIVIAVDVVFLALIWAMILTGLYDAVWVKLLFTIIFPILTLSMLRNMMIYPFDANDKEHNDLDASNDTGIDESGSKNDLKKNE